METKPIGQGPGTMLPIDEFARRQGMSKRKVRHYVKIGQVHIRKIEGKKFVVDSPLIQQTTPPRDVRQTQLALQSGAPSIPEPETAQMTAINPAFIRAQAKSKTRWQNYAFVVTILLAAAVVAGFWLYLDNQFLNQNHQAMSTDKYARIKQLHLANARADETSLQLAVLRNQYNQLAIENVALKAENTRAFSNVQAATNKTANPIVTAEIPQNNPLITELAEKPEISSKLPPLKDEFNAPQEQKRRNSILRGDYPKDMTRDDLLAALGQPDRIYKSKVYEQWLYFDRSPGRFWFKNSPYAECTE